jgi:hypothetical protein
MLDINYVLAYNIDVGSESNITDPQGLNGLTTDTPPLFNNVLYGV